MVNVEIKLENMDKSAQFQTPVQNIHFIDLTVDSLGCSYKNIGSRQDNCFSVNVFVDISLRNYYTDRF